MLSLQTASEAARRIAGLNDIMLVDNSAMFIPRLSVKCGDGDSDILVTVTKTKTTTSFFPIVDTCLSCEDIARQSCTMVRRWLHFGDFLRPAFPASRVQHVLDLYPKFALRQRVEVWQTSNLRPLSLGEEKKEKKRKKRKKKTNDRMKIYMVCPIT